MICNLCPRKCGVDRTKTTGFCSVADTLKISRAALHFYEEPPISAQNGSGTVFFSGCNLKCVYCQNKEISRGFGKEISVTRLSQIFLELQESGAHNINLVTPDHFVPQIKSALVLAKENGLSIPIVYNTSGYCSVETLRLLDGLVDVYLTDFKYFDDALSLKYSGAKDYKHIAKLATKEMFRQVGCPKFDKNGVMQKGVIVRHLVLPGFLDNSKDILEYLYATYKDDVYISIMNQFTPINLEKFPEINRTVSEQEYQEIVMFANMLGIKHAFIQEGKTQSESFIPDFSCFEGV